MQKYGSDSERDSIMGHHEITPSHSRGHSQLFVSSRVAYPVHPHPHPHLNHSRESFSFEPPFHHHVHSPSVDVGGSRRPPDLLESGGTFPRKNQRFRVPSNPSVTSKVSAQDTIFLIPSYENMVPHFRWSVGAISFKRRKI